MERMKLFALTGAMLAIGGVIGAALTSAEGAQPVTTQWTVIPTAGVGNEVALMFTNANGELVTCYSQHTGPSQPYSKPICSEVGKLP